MKTFKILTSNIGYARGLNGCLKQHIMHSYRHIYCPINIQHQAIEELKAIIELEEPDIGCLIEIDKGSFNNSYFNQMEKIIGENYPFFDIENKYEKKGFLSKIPIFSGKCNGFFAKTEVNYQKLSFTSGTKRLIYRLELENDITLFFTHFSLNKEVRAKQFKEIRNLVDNEKNKVIIMGDFNIFDGFKELDPLLKNSNLHILNNEALPTFTFHKYKYPLDLCICSSSLVPNLVLRIIAQPFSDHDALLLTINPSL